MNDGIGDAGLIILAVSQLVGIAIGGMRYYFRDNPVEGPKTLFIALTLGLIFAAAITIRGWEMTPWYSMLSDTLIGGISGACTAVATAEVQKKGTATVETRVGEVTLTTTQEVPASAEGAAADANS